MKFLKELLPSLIVRISFSIIVFLTAFLSIYFVYQRSILAIINGFFVPGAILLAVCVFSILNNFGFFDFASYGFISVIQSLKKGSVRQYEDLIDYKSRKIDKRKENRFSFIPYLISGIILITISIVIKLIYKMWHYILNQIAVLIVLLFLI